MKAGEDLDEDYEDAEEDADEDADEYDGNQATATDVLIEADDATLGASALPAEQYSEPPGVNQAPVAAVWRRPQPQPGDFYSLTDMNPDARYKKKSSPFETKDKHLWRRAIELTARKYPKNIEKIEGEWYVFGEVRKQPVSAGLSRI